MKYDIYFHNDFDGHSSAAIALAFFEGRGDIIEHFVPVDFDLLPQWQREDFFQSHKLFKGTHNPAIVVDFPFHPKAVFWFDHHEAPFKMKGWEKRFKQDAAHHLYSDYPSCCRVVYDALKKSYAWKAPARLRELVHWADIIDGAQYASAKQTLLFKEPALRIDVFLDNTPRDAKKSKTMIRLFANKTLGQIAAMPNVRRVASKIKKMAAQKLTFYKKEIKNFGTASFIDLTAQPSNMLRYAPYYLFPRSRYAIRLSKKGSHFHLGIGANPWTAFTHTVPIGTMLKKYGGGGHNDAGAADFKKREDAMKALEEVIVLLNKR